MAGVEVLLNLTVVEKALPYYLTLVEEEGQQNFLQTLEAVVADLLNFLEKNLGSKL